jgi:putative ABC transport system substrate-binding protein
MKHLTKTGNSPLIAQHSVLCAALCAMLFALCSVVEAQQPNKILRIGFLAALSPSAIAARVEAFKQGLAELGYVEGKNIVIDYRWANGKFEQVPALAAEMVNLKVAVIVTAGPTDTRAAKQATSTIPIVMAFDNDPVGSGFVATLARPGGNITGLSTLTPETTGKRLEILKEIVPRLGRAVVFGTSTEPGKEQSFKETQSAAASLGIHLHYIEIGIATDIEPAFREAARDHADAILVLNSPVLNSRREELAELAIKSRLPTAYGQGEYVQAGGLMSYGPNIVELFRRTATYVDKIFKGAKPSELPVQQPTTFEFIINLNTAKQIGLTIPPNVLTRADKVIK